MNVLLLPAVCHSDAELLERLVKHGANIHGTYGPDNDTLLHIAIRKLWSSLRPSCALFDVIRLLLSGGARVDALNSRGLSALHLLCLHLSNAPQSGYAHRTKVLDMLLKAGANVNLPQPGTGATPLHCALLYGPNSYLDCVTELLSAGANPLSKMYVPDSGSVFFFGWPVFERLPRPLLLHTHRVWRAERQNIMRLLDAVEIPHTDMRCAEFWVPATLAVPVSVYGDVGSKSSSRTMDGVPAKKRAMERVAQVQSSRVVVPAELEPLTKYHPPVADARGLNVLEAVTSYLPRKGVITAFDMAKTDNVADDGNTLYCALIKAVPSHLPREGVITALDFSNE